MLNFLIVLATFWCMEFMAWFSHKYIMHGLLWYLHKDHHQPEPGFFEKNDWFFMMYAVPSALLIVLGSMHNFDYRFYIGIGILIYGIAYFLVHEVLIHERFDWFKRARHPYLMALKKAHKRHHAHKGKEEGECFGMLVVPKKYFKKRTIKS